MSLGFGSNLEATHEGLAHPLRAAEYVRMSTEHQKYSTENQSAAIREYASANNIEIVRTYSDRGKSGLSIEGRGALAKLIADVEAGATDFDIVLVYDVSRWGRFQDTDESAYYEFACRRSGIAVQYCAEQFQNDGSPLAAVIKGLKRAMAGEYSRELSQKVFAGQSRMVKSGFRLGGRPGYGLRRELRDHNGSVKGVLGLCERKSIQTDRVVLVPGPREEVETVRWIFEVFATGKLSECQIANTLNERGLRTSTGRPWSSGFVSRMLRSEKYAGVSVWNTSSFKLKAKRVRNPVEQWIRVENAFQPVIDRALYDAAQKAMRDRKWQRSREAMAERLAQVYRDHGRITYSLVEQVLGKAAALRYRVVWGSLALACEEAGVPQRRNYRFVRLNRGLQDTRVRVMAEIVEGTEIRGGKAELQGRFLRINDQFRVAVLVLRCVPCGPKGLRWHRFARIDRAADVLVAVRMESDNSAIRDYCILPGAEVVTRLLRLSERRDRLTDCYGSPDLTPLFNMAARLALGTAP